MERNRRVTVGDPPNTVALQKAQGRAHPEVHRPAVAALAAQPGEAVRESDMAGNVDGQPANLGLDRPLEAVEPGLGGFDIGRRARAQL